MTGYDLLWLRRVGCVVLMCFVLMASGNAAEYFVSLDGSDAADGRSASTAFATVQRGLDALEAGDVLTILPGEYFGAVSRDNLGGEGVETVIRAARRGTVLLRGDVPAPDFEPVAGRAGVFRGAFDGDPQAVNEVDTLTIFESAPSIAALEFQPGAFYYDADAGMLYISTSDARPSGEHLYTVSVVGNNGLFLHQPVGVVVDGIGATGFHSKDIAPGAPGAYAVAGILLGSATDCTIRNCTAYLNANGLVIDSGSYGRYGVGDRGLPSYGAVVRSRGAGGPGRNTIEFSHGYANSSRHSGEGGNITVFNSHYDVIRGCTSHSSSTHGIRHYGAITGPADMYECISWGNLINDLHTKGGRAREVGYAERCVALGPVHVAQLDHCIYGAENRYNSDPGPTNIRYDLDVIGGAEQQFADPAHLDFRLQSGSVFRNAAPDGSDRGAYPYEPVVFFVGPGGDDAADGLSLASAWRTLSRATAALNPGDTLYLLAGTYPEALDLSLGSPSEDPVSIRGHGDCVVTLSGEVRVRNGHQLDLRRLQFASPLLIADSSQISMNNCLMPTLFVSGVNGLSVEHSLFTGGSGALVDIKESDVIELSANLFNNAAAPAVAVDRLGAVVYADYNNYSNPELAWRINKQLSSLDGLPGVGYERYASSVATDFHSIAGRDLTAALNAFAGTGPLGTDRGFYSAWQQRVVRVTEPVVGSVTATTANIEWRTSVPARCELVWGEAGGSSSTVTVNSDGFGSWSLTGLEPDTEYSVRLTSALPLQLPKISYSVVVADSAAAPAARVVGSESIRFRTAAAARDGVVYHVAVAGDDSADGLTPGTALRTIQRAADLALAGDTVLIGGGVYQETVFIRNTGEPGNPVVFRGAPGERAVLDGVDQQVGRGFVVYGKNNIHFDNLYFENFAPDTHTSGIFCLYMSDGIQITRCLYDGYAGYSPSFVMAYGCRDLVIRNCVSVGVFYGSLYIVNCPDVVIENNVLFRSRIGQVILVNHPDQPARLRNNIITDNQPTKVKVGLVELASIGGLDEGNNGFTFRIPADERNAFMVYDATAYGRTVETYGIEPVKEGQLLDKLSMLTVAAFQELSGDATSIVRDPLFHGVEGVEMTTGDGTPIFPPDRLAGKKDKQFSDFFATDPDYIERGIGLQQKAFE